MSSTITLTTQITIPNAVKMDISRPDFNDDLTECKFTVTLNAGASTGTRVCSWNMTIRDGISDMVARQSSPAVGLNVEDSTRYVILSTRTTATGYTDLIAAWRTNGTSVNRQAAFKALLLSAGHVDSTLTGT